MALIDFAGSVTLPDNAMLDTAKLRLTLVSWDMGGDVVYAPGPFEFDVASDGAYDFSLQSTLDLDRMSAYSVDLVFDDTIQRRVKTTNLGLIQVPATGGPYSLPDLLSVPIESATDTDVLAQCAAYAAAAQDAADLAVASIAVSDKITPQMFGAVGDGATDDTAAVTACVALAHANGEEIYWAAGTYKTTASIPYLHVVRHRGPGKISRSGNVFSPCPSDADTNTLFINNSTGATGNDGLSTSQPKATFQNTFDALDNYGPVLNGNWVISAAAGTYTISTGQQTFSTPSKNRVVIKGATAGHPNVPTTIIDGGGNKAGYLHGLSASGNGVMVEFRDLKAQNFTEASGNTRIGLLGENGSDVYFTNCHTASCSWCGIYVFACDRGRVAGGIVDGASISGAGGIFINTTPCTVGYGASSTADGPIVKNCDIGINWSRGTQGHIDYAIVQDCDYGIQIGENSRAHIVGADLRRNAYGLRCITGGVFTESGGDVIVWNRGTADANTNDFIFAAYSGNADQLYQGMSEYRAAYDRTTRTVSGVTAGTFPAIYTIPAYRMKGPARTCRVKVNGIYTASSGSVITVNFGGMALTMAVPAAATSQVFCIEADLLEVSGGYRSFGRLTHSMESPRMSHTPTGFTSTSDQDVSVGYSLTGAGDSMTVYRVEVWLVG